MRHQTWHPEWGFVAPAPNFIRAVRIGLVAAAVGATICAGVVLSLVDSSANQMSVAARTSARPLQAPLTPVSAQRIQRPPSRQPVIAEKLQLRYRLPPERGQPLIWRRRKRRRTRSTALGRVTRRAADSRSFTGPAASHPGLARCAAFNHSRLRAPMRPPLRRRKGPSYLAPAPEQRPRWCASQQVLRASTGRRLGPEKSSFVRCVTFCLRAGESRIRDKLWEGFSNERY